MWLNSVIHGNYNFFTQSQTFLSNVKIWHYTDFRNLQWIPLRCFSAKTRQFPRFLYLPPSTLENTLLSHILANFWKLNDFKIDVFTQALGRFISLGLNWHFLEIPPVSCFRFASIGQNKNAESAEVFKFSSSSEDFDHT